MNIFGYAHSDKDLLELREVSLQVTPAELDGLIQFLCSVKDRLPQFESVHEHEHFRDWQKSQGIDVCGDAPDIIVCRQLN